MRGFTGALADAGRCAKSAAVDASLSNRHIERKDAKVMLAEDETERCIAEKQFEKQ